MGVTLSPVDADSRRCAFARRSSRRCTAPRRAVIAHRTCPKRACLVGHAGLEARARPSTQVLRTLHTSGKIVKGGGRGEWPIANILLSCAPLLLRPRRSPHKSAMVFHSQVLDVYKNCSCCAVRQAAARAMQIMLMGIRHFKPDRRHPAVLQPT